MRIIKNTHIGAYAIIIRNNQIALIKKANGAYKGKYDLPGGGIEHTETPIEALHRECMEEIGATVIEEQLLDVTSINVTWKIKENLKEDLHHIGVLYITEIKEDKLKEIPDGIDSNGSLWVPINLLKQDMVSPFTWYALQKLEYKNK